MAAFALTNAASAQNVPFTVMLTELVQLDADVDLLGGRLGDYYAEVTINGSTQSNHPACGDGSNPFQGIIVPFELFSYFARTDDCDRSTPWIFTRQVPVNAPVSVTIRVFDSDDLSGDDEADLLPGDGNGITLSVNPTTGQWSGDIDWPQACGRENGDLGGDNARVCWQIGFDSDGDGLLNIWESSGLDVDYDGMVDVDLPGYGADPLHKDLFVELDWMGGNAPLRAEIQEWKAAFAAAPVDAGGTSNPDGLPGINLWVDTGGLTDALGNLVGDNLGGGNQVAFANVSNLNDAFYAIKTSNFARARELVFRYGLSSADPANDVGTSTGGNTATTLNDTNQSWLADEWTTNGGRTVQITSGTGSGQMRTVTDNTATRLTVSASWNTIPDATSTYRISSIGGQGELGGNDFIDYNHTASTLMHELGHTLNLGHGGGPGLAGNTAQIGHNCKPNYVSIMNYDHDRIFRLGAPDIIDFSMPLQVLGGRSTAVPPDLNESLLNEATILDATDPDNLFVFVEQGVCVGGGDAGSVCTVDSDCDALACQGTKVMTPLDSAVDWNGDGDATDGSLSVNIDTANALGNPAGCANNDLTTALKGHNDWRNISLPLAQFGDSADDAINLLDEPEPTLEERQLLNQALNTTDLGITQTAPATVEVGDSFNLTLTLGNDGPNPALGVGVDVGASPAATSLLAPVPSECVEGAPGTVSCTLESMLRGAELDIDLVIGMNPSVCVAGVPQELTSAATVENIARFAGADPNAADNTSVVTITPVDTTPPVIESVAATPDRLWPPNHQMVPVSVAVVVNDICDTTPACRIIDVSSNEPLNGVGDGNSTPDWVFTGVLSVNLRAERAGPGTGRTYTIKTECVDGSGNAAVDTVDVFAPRSRAR